MPPLLSTPRRSGAEAAEGFRWLRRHPVLGPLTLAYVIYYLGFAASFSLMVVLITDELDGSSISFGLVLAAGAAGAVLGALAGSRLSAALGTRTTLAASVALQAITVAAVASSRSTVAVAALWFLNGVPGGIGRPVGRSLEQRLTPNHLLGRVNVTSRILTRGIIVVGAVLAGALATATNVRWSFATGAIIQLAAAAIIWTVLAPITTAPPEKP